MLIYSFLQCPLGLTNINSLITFVADERIDYVSVTASWILSCSILTSLEELCTSSICKAWHTLQEHALSDCFNALFVFPCTRVSARFLSLLYAIIGGVWNAFAILSDLCSTGRCFRTILWMSGRCFEKVSTKGILSSFSS